MNNGVDHGAYVQGFALGTGDEFVYTVPPKETGQDRLDALDDRVARGGFVSKEELIAAMDAVTREAGRAE